MSGEINWLADREYDRPLSASLRPHYYSLETGFSARVSSSEEALTATGLSNLASVVDYEQSPPCAAINHEFCQKRKKPGICRVRRVQQKRKIGHTYCAPSAQRAACLCTPDTIAIH